LVGATGAGKSTLLNYLASDDSNFVVFNEDGAIKTLKKSVAEIGGGVSATTLYPNMYECDLGVFLDCAGEGDTGGIIIEIINSIIKNEISKHV
jgi:predicted GTPase